MTHDSLQRKVTFGIFLGSKGADVPVDFQRLDESRDDANGELQHLCSRHCQGLQPAQRHGAVLEADRPGLGFPDPPGGFPGMYLSRADTEALIANRLLAIRVR